MADRDESPSPKQAEGEDEAARAAQGPRLDWGSGWGGAPSAEAARKLARALEESPAEWEVPERYGRDRVMLLARDPRWAFLYWEITAEGRSALEGRVRAETGEAGRWELRWGEGEAAWGGPPPGAALSEAAWEFGTHYATLEGPARSMRAWIGLCVRGARFFPLCASPPVDFRDFAPVAEGEAALREIWRNERGETVEPPELRPGAEAIFRSLWRGLRPIGPEEFEIDAWGSLQLARRLGRGAFGSAGAALERKKSGGGDG